MRHRVYAPAETARESALKVDQALAVIIDTIAQHAGARAKFLTAPIVDVVQDAAREAGLIVPVDAASRTRQ